MKPYPSYKDSGVEWVGKIPSGWVVDKIKNIFWERKETNNPIKSDNLISLTLEKGVIPHSEKGSSGNKPKDDISKYKLVYPGDIVLNSMNVIVGSVGLSKYFGVVSPVYYMLIPSDKKDDVTYFHQMFRGKMFQKSLIGLGNGILIKHSEKSGKTNTIRMRIPMSKLNQERIPYPPKKEQQQISNYLDQKTKLIDELIKKTEQKIELLKENRTSLINHCVTKGLDSNVEMKDSSVEWIGEIPREWSVMKLKYFCEIIYGISPPNTTYNDERVGTVLVNGPVEYSESDFGLTRSLKWTTDPKKMTTKGSLLFCLRGSTGRMNVTHQDLSIGRGVCSLNSKECQWFMIYSLMILRIHIQELISGSIFSSVVKDDVDNYQICSPPLPEQQQISNHLDKETQKIDTLIEKENKRIELLKEYRQSLIFEVVTGKIDVRDEVLQ